MSKVKFIQDPTKCYDFLNNELNAGDKVIFIYGRSLKQSKIEHIVSSSNGWHNGSVKIEGFKISIEASKTYKKHPSSEDK